MIQMYLAVAVLVLCLYFKYKCSYWFRRKVEGPSPLPIFGNIFDFIVTKKKHIGEIYREIYEWVCGTEASFSWRLELFRSHPAARYVGFYKIGTPALLIRDLDLIKDILVTKFNSFNKNDFAVDPKVRTLREIWVRYSAWLHFSAWPFARP